MTLDWLDLTLGGLAPDRQLQVARMARRGAVGLLVIVTILTLVPDTLAGDIERFGIDDKAGHILAYVSLMSSWAYAVASPMARLQVLGALAAYGGLLGFQALMGYGRQASWEDMVANSLGLLIGLALAVMVARVFRQIHRKFAERN